MQSLPHSPSLRSIHVVKNKPVSGSKGFKATRHSIPTLNKTGVDIEIPFELEQIAYYRGEAAALNY
jgi:hypothetical protein